MHSELGAPVAILPVSAGSQSALSRWLPSWFAGASEEERATMVQGAYALWLPRNDTREGKKIAEAHVIAGLVMAHMEDWKSVHGNKERKMH